MAETIIAPATAPGVSALAVIRISGPEAVACTDRLLAVPVAWKPQRAYYRSLVADGALLDEAVLTYWRGPRSFTGEDLVEISCHGNPFLVERIVAAYLAQGVRRAGPGEFTQRAFLNGRIDLTQAEAVADLIEAATDREIRGAQAMLRGKLGLRIGELRTDLIDLLAHLEAYIDFPDEDITPETGQGFLAAVERVLGGVERLLATAPLGRILRQGVVTAIVGAPNVGKSSLFNALAREDRAIVSPLPGTTRDVLETECRIGDFRLRLLDTAGQRETGDAIEAEGVRRAASAGARAELVIHLFEAAVPFARQPFTLPSPEPGQIVVAVAGKCDLGVAPENAAYPALSTRTGEGLDRLGEIIARALLGTERAAGDDALTVNSRQEEALRAARAALETARDGLRRGDAPELTSIVLREALRAVGEVVGVATNEDVLDALFKKFCIGK